MFDRNIIETYDFMDLSPSNIAAYFLLGMFADDEGFIFPRGILNTYKIFKEDLTELENKGYIIHCGQGVIVITDWNKNNWLDKRWFKATEYQKEKSLLVLQDKKYFKKDDPLVRSKETLRELQKNSKRALRELSELKNIEKSALRELQENSKRPLGVLEDSKISKISKMSDFSLEKSEMHNADAGEEPEGEHTNKFTQLRAELEGLGILKEKTDDPDPSGFPHD